MASHVHRIRALAAAALIGLWLAACTGHDGGESAGPPTDGEPAQEIVRAIDAHRSAPAPPIPGATAGGVLTVAAGGTNFTNLDPSGAYWNDLNSILSGLVVRSLTQLVYDTDTATMVLVPDLATDVGTPNEDFTEWTFTIRPGVRFEDGTPVTAEDVAYGIKRSFDRVTFPTGADYSNQYFLDGDTYRGPYRSGTDYPGIVVNGDTLTLKMARPFVDLPYWASWPAMSPIPPPPTSTPSTYGDHPLATGPYKVARYTDRFDMRVLRLVRNEEWDPDTDPGRHQYVEEFRFRFSPESADSVSRAIVSGAPVGEASAAYLLSGDTVGEARAAGAGVASGPDQCVYVAALDMRKITDLRVRQAIGYAYPYRAANRALGGGRRPSRSLLPPGTPGALDYNPLATAPGVTDARQSRALLQGAGYGPGDYRIDFPYDEEFQEPTALVIARGLTAGGFHAVAHPVAHDFYSAQRDDPESPYNLRLVGWCSDFPDGYRSLLGQFASETSFPDLTFLSDPDVEAEVDRIAGLPLEDQAAQWGVFDRAIETGLYPYVVTGVQTNEAIYGSRVGGVRMGSDGMPTWRDVFVKQ